MITIASIDSFTSYSKKFVTSKMKLIDSSRIILALKFRLHEMQQFTYIKFAKTI